MHAASYGWERPRPAMKGIVEVAKIMAKVSE
jgi:hypothetical protein